MPQLHTASRETIAAFLNTREGGILPIGIADDGLVLSLILSRRLPPQVLNPCEVLKLLTYLKGVSNTGDLSFAHTDADGNPQRGASRRWAS
jgi:hypothetical protein